MRGNAAGAWRQRQALQRTWFARKRLLGCDTRSYEGSGIGYGVAGSGAVWGGKSGQGRLFPAK